MEFWSFKQRTPAKKAKKTNESEEPFWELDNYKRVTIREFRGKTFIDIREFYQKDGQQLPGKKGITLSPALWKKLMEHSEDITKTIDAK